jgi:hypothetical protein
MTDVNVTMKSSQAISCVSMELVYNVLETILLSSSRIDVPQSLMLEAEIVSETFF